VLGTMARLAGAKLHLSEFIFAWADVRIAETDDVAKLLEARECSCSTCPLGWLLTGVSFPPAWPLVRLYPLSFASLFYSLRCAEDLKANSSTAGPAKKVEKVEKKKKRKRALLITNSHMKEFVSGKKVCNCSDTRRVSTFRRTTRRARRLRLRSWWWCRVCARDSCSYRYGRRMWSRCIYIRTVVFCHQLMSAAAVASGGMVVL
jgi:hypothetical protein